MTFTGMVAATVPQLATNAWPLPGSGNGFAESVETSNGRPFAISKQLSLSDVLRLTTTRAQ